MEHILQCLLPCLNTGGDLELLFTVKKKQQTDLGGSTLYNS